MSEFVPDEERDIMTEEQEVEFNRIISKIGFGAKALDLAKRCLELAQHGDYSNGVEAQGCDEGRYMAYRYLGELEAELKELEA